MSEAVTVPSLMMMTAIVSEESLARDTHTRTLAHTHTHTHSHTLAHSHTHTLTRTHTRTRRLWVVNFLLFQSKTLKTKRKGRG